MRLFAGTPWRWCCVPANIPTSAGISPPPIGRGALRCGVHALSSVGAPMISPATWCISRAIPPPAFMPAAISEGRIDELLDSFRPRIRAASPPTRTPVHCGFLAISTVSMGLGPLTAAYQAPLHAYLEYRELKPHQGERCGRFSATARDGSTRIAGSVALGGREKTPDNPDLRRELQPAAAGWPRARSTAKIIPGLEEAPSEAAGWQVITGDLGQQLRDELLQRPLRAADATMIRVRRRRLPNASSRKAAPMCQGSYIFDSIRVVQALFADLSDDEIWALHRGGHDPERCTAAYHQAVHTRAGRRWCWPKPSKGLAWGKPGEGQNINHQLKK